MTSTFGVSYKRGDYPKLKKLAEVQEKVVHMMLDKSLIDKTYF